MKYAILFLVVFLMACGQGKKYHDEEKKAGTESDLAADILEYQEEQNESFKDPDSSPLPDKYRKDFEGLDFFAPDTSYIVKARLERTPDAEPFLMPTTTETYGGGRYIDLTIPEGDTLVIDFNKAYNPYCVYNKKYSCPLVPRQNYLRTKVRAGVKNFNKD